MNEEESDSDSELDLSWTISNSSPNYEEKKTFPKLINSFFVYISKKNVILSVIKIQIPTIINEKDNICFISKEKILKYIQQNKIIIRNKNKTCSNVFQKSDLDETTKNKTLKNKTVKYHINELVLYIAGENEEEKSISFLNDVIINSTDEKLHKLNSLYFLMKE